MGQKLSLVEGQLGEVLAPGQRALTTTHKLLLASAGTFLKRSSKSVRVDVSLFAYGDTCMLILCIPRDPIERLMQQGDATHSSSLHTLLLPPFRFPPSLPCRNSF